MSERENNISITGDEARILVAALRTMTLSAPISMTLELYYRLIAISQVQPPSQPAQKTSNEDN